MTKHKWAEYVNRLGRCEDALRLAIKDYRDYKKMVFKHKYENERSPYLRRIFDASPNTLLDKIDELNVKIKFCKLKVEYYRTITKEGETIENRISLVQIATKCSKMLNHYSHLQHWP